MITQKIVFSLRKIKKEEILVLISLYVDDMVITGVNKETKKKNWDNKENF